MTHRTHPLIHQLKALKVKKIAIFWGLVTFLILAIAGFNQSLANSITSKQSPVLLGLYTQGYAGEQNIIDQQLRQLDTWAGKKHTLVGIFMDIQDENPAYNIGNRLEILWQNGYTALINLKSIGLASEIAQGNLDQSIQKVAQAVANWTNKGDGRMMFIAPLPEMNIAGETYSLDAQNFKQAYMRLQQIFTEASVSPASVRWVFAPNGFSFTREHDFENYYPGDQRVDVVGFSAYNWGYCQHPLNQRKLWDKPEDTYDSYINRMKKIAPLKPIFITQTASSSYSKPMTADALAKEAWLYAAYQHLALASSVQAIIYFNIAKECDWHLNTQIDTQIKSQNSNMTKSYKTVVADDAFAYVSPQSIGQIFSRSQN
ncbi:hypothetical protein Syn7502_00303 [Synechococcus sp. PCC 7502]|uniref:glycosyl hydrolase n=1 Tax=Synechococcus sp. PCC 7502 TaxID=1173263 RepID=UPI00029FBA7E|nr:glycosyl hydrolase [Synechococcus sp. PCC 7502]AFY72470.1 hypothetical protein Syn7502_00303 [Synechococcus sp. PCC 7502]